MDLKLFSGTNLFSCLFQSLLFSLSLSDRSQRRAIQRAPSCRRPEPRTFRGAAITGAESEPREAIELGQAGMWDENTDAKGAKVRIHMKLINSLTTCLRGLHHSRVSRARVGKMSELRPTPQLRCSCQGPAKPELRLLQDRMLLVAPFVFFTSASTSRTPRRHTKRGAFGSKHRLWNSTPREDQVLFAILT